MKSSRGPRAADTPPARLWLVFFGDTSRRAWWANVLRPGFRHLWAMSWYAAEERWVYFNPSSEGTVIRILTAEQGPVVIDQLLARSTAVLRVATRYQRGTAPVLPWCVGQIKALLGLRSWALTPYALYRDLRARGAEPVPLAGPCVAADPEAAARCVA